MHHHFRNLTKTKDAFLNKNCLFKLVYMGIQNAIKKMGHTDPKLISDNFSANNLY